MKIIKHRSHSLPRGDIEIDLRLADNDIIVTHDVYDRFFMDMTIDSLFLLTFLEKWLKNSDESAILALNIKEDGTAPYLKKILEKTKVPPERIFAFDMAQTEIPAYQRKGIPIATRISNYGIERPTGSYIWFDWYPTPTNSPEDLLTLARRAYFELATYRDFEIHNDYRVIAVSPELHNVHDPRIIDRLWSLAKKHKFFGICTDLVEEAEGFFNGNKGDPV